MKLLEKKVICIILLIIIFIEIIIIVIKHDSCGGIPLHMKCSSAFNCKVDEKNPENMICDYYSEDETDAIDKVTCPNTFCEDVYSCEVNKENQKIMDCKYNYNGEVRDVKCPNSEVYND